MFEEYHSKKRVEKMVNKTRKELPVKIQSWKQQITEVEILLED